MSANDELSVIVEEAVACSTVATERAMEKLDRGELLESRGHDYASNGYFEDSEVEYV
jgi:hypothetical protein